MMQLKAMHKVWPQAQWMGDLSADITDVAYHLDQVKPGSCFVAIRGFKTDGHLFIADAVAKGACAVVVQQDVAVPPQVAKVIVADTRAALAQLSAQFFGAPSQELTLIGITGTNGKTTTAYLLETILQAAGHSTGLVSTVDYRYRTAGGKTRHFDVTHTTPESTVLQKMLREMADHAISHCVMEVTSHALDLQRVAETHFDGAIFTNLTPDHLDYHADLESYYACKEKLFVDQLARSNKSPVWGVVNVDDPYGEKLANKFSAGRLYRYSLHRPVEVFAKQWRADLSGLAMTVATPEGEWALSSPLVGRFNASNVLGAVAAALAMQIPVATIQQAAAGFVSPPGRLERVALDRPFQVLVDFAHTPDALQNILTTLQPLVTGRLITVFGCGGDRDRLKRPLMGKIAGQYSDVVIVTSDNPRSENPESIVAEILPGLSAAGKKNYQVIVDRKEAICAALRLARNGDCVLIAGKGHEQYQIIGNARHPFDDRAVARECGHAI